MAALLAALPKGWASSEQATDPWTDFQVTTFNVRNSTMRDRGQNSWPSRFPIATQMLIAQGSNVLGLQEVSEEQRLDLDRALPDYSAIGKGRDGQGRGEQCPIYSLVGLKPQSWGTFWLSQTPSRPSTGWDAKMPRTCTWIEYPGMTVFNTHLDFQGVESRREALKLIRKRIHGTAIIMGDFNDQEGANSLQPVADLVDAYRAVHAQGPLADETTYHAFKGDRHPGPRIDFIFVTPDLTPVEAHIVRESNPSGPFPSDHRAVTVRLQKHR